MEELTRLQTSRRAYRSHVTRIFNKIEDTLEDTIMDSEELQDTIAEKINELNKRIELLSQPSSKKSGDDHTVTIPETDSNSDTTSGDCRETVATETSIENI